MDRHRLAAFVVALVSAVTVAGCGSAGGGGASGQGPGGQTATGPQIVAWSPCHDPGQSSPGVLEAFRMGAVDFTSATTGVGITATSFQCFHSIRGGVESVTQGSPERLAATDDGGRSWVLTGEPLPRPASRGSQVPQAIFSAGTGSIWAVGSDGRPFVTTNDGRSWSLLSLPTPVTDLTAAGGYLWAFSCPRSGEVSCIPMLSRMRIDSGHWRILNVPPIAAVTPRWAPLPGHNAVVSILSAGHSRGELLISSHAGSLWSVRAMPRWQGQPCNVAGLTSSDRTIWLLCLGGAAAGSSTKALLASDDGGASWQVRSEVADLSAPHRPGRLPVAEPSALAAASPSRLWLALTNGLSTSTDGGRHWTQAPAVNGQGQATAVDVLSATRAWILAPGAGLWQTTDGRQWAPVGPLNTG